MEEIKIQANNQALADFSKKLNVKNLNFGNIQDFQKLAGLKAMPDLSKVDINNLTENLPNSELLKKLGVSNLNNAQLAALGDLAKNNLKNNIATGLDTNMPRNGLNNLSNNHQNINTNNFIKHDLLNNISHSNIEEIKNKLSNNTNLANFTHLQTLNSKNIDINQIKHNILELNNLPENLSKYYFNVDNNQLSSKIPNLDINNLGADEFSKHISNPNIDLNNLAGNLTNKIPNVDITNQLKNSLSNEPNMPALDFNDIKDKILKDSSNNISDITKNIPDINLNQLKSQFHNLDLNSINDLAKKLPNIQDLLKSNMLCKKCFII